MIRGNNMRIIELKKEIGKRISEIRLDHNLTQEQLSEMLDCTCKHITSVENGKGFMSIAMLMDFCELMDCNMEYVIRGRCLNTESIELPDEIMRILVSGNQNEKRRLKKYMETYVELMPPVYKRRKRSE